jgi:hypothetical protein
MDDLVLQTLTEFGAAGLIGIMWLCERGRAARRDRQLDEAHRRLMSQRRDLKLWMAIVAKNTRALGGLELAHRDLLRMLRRWRHRASSTDDGT